MKIGIISMQRIVNYGSYMQALSMKLILESLGHEVVFIDFKPNVLVSERNKKLLVLKKKLSNIKEYIKSSNLGKMIISYKRRKLPTSKQELFESCYSILGMKSKLNYYKKYSLDVLLVGSDEVFNCLQSNRRVGYCMDFFGKRKLANKIISYAASFGSTTYDKLCKYDVAEEIQKYLLKFDAISVRDDNSYNIVNGLTGIMPEVNLDPVLVGWLEKLSWQDVTEKNYIIVYGYQGRFSDLEKDYIRQFALKKNMKLISLCDDQDFCDENIQCKPDQILSYFKNANYIITDTFHGTIFSVLFHKKFVTFCRKQSNTGSTNAEKVMDLVSRLDLTERIVEDIGKLSCIIDKKIDYCKVDRIRMQEREHTFEYLKKVL